MQVRLVAGVVLAGLLLAGCGSGANHTPNQGGASRQTAPGVERSSHSAAVYHAVDDLCATADLTALTQLYPRQSQTRPDVQRSPVRTAMRCESVFQGSEGGGWMELEADVADNPDSITNMYDGLRKAESKAAPGGTVTDVAGLGTAAYTFNDEGLGPKVVVVDGNLYLTIVWSPTPGSSAPSDIVTRLQTVCKATMAKLRS